MAQPKIFIFAPADPTGDTHRQLEQAGCELVLGDASWHTPQGNNEDEIADLASQADALMGTSIRSSPISRRILQSSEGLRIVAKYTIGVDDVGRRRRHGAGHTGHPLPNGVQTGAAWQRALWP